METRLQLYVYVDGVNDIPFHGADYIRFIDLNGETFLTKSGEIFMLRTLNENIEVGNFRYTAQRMGAVPTIEFTLKYPTSLDGLWSNDIYAIFNGKRFFLKQTPSSQKTNTEDGYSYDVELVDERIILDNTYFFDATINPNTEDKPVSNGTKFNFFGDIKAFAERLNNSLLYSKLQKRDDEGNIIGYRIIVDEGISTEEKFVSFEDAFFSNAIQESFNTFEIPYYFKNQEIHFGYTDNLIGEVFEYGIDNSLLSIKMENSNNKVINRATAIGSSENIPFYYPNNSPKGNIKASSSDGKSVSIIDGALYADKIQLKGTISYHKYGGSMSIGSLELSFDGLEFNDFSNPQNYFQKDSNIWIKVPITVTSKGYFALSSYIKIDNGNKQDNPYIKYAYLMRSFSDKSLNIDNNNIDLGFLTEGDYNIVIGMGFQSITQVGFMVEFSFNYYASPFYLNDENGSPISLEQVGLKYDGGTPATDIIITQDLDSFIQFADALMPPKYRKTEGNERFYNAVNNPAYIDEEGNEIVFPNPYSEGHPSENIFTEEDIKPTIKNTRNADNQRIDMFADIAYDLNDSDEVYNDAEGNTVYKHPHFFVKLRKLPFNLFDQAIEGGEMTISITSGQCGACSFKVKVDSEFPYSNPVQVDENGNLIYDDNGMVLCGLEDVQPKVVAQERQQDTINNEVWIALEKEEDTYGILMPKAPKYNEQGELLESGYRIKPCTDGNSEDGDTFIILNINLPKEYIEYAEKELEKAIIRHLQENNTEKFNFSIVFSKIFFAENPSILEVLDENARIQVKYNNEIHLLYVSSFNYEMSGGESLPNISVELADTLSTSQNAIQNVASQVELSVFETISKVDIVSSGGRYFLRKDIDDTVNSKINFKNGVKFGDGGSIEIDENNNTRLSIDYLQVNKKATFTSLEIQEREHIGGQILITPASMVCSRVEELEDSYKCYFETTAQDGSEIFNKFVVGDQAICQTFNEWANKYYWRLVVGVGVDYILLSKNDCDANSSTPNSGDKIIQFGNRNDESRQSAILLSSTGDNSPSFILYNNVNSYSLSQKDITAIEWNKEKGEPQLYSYGSFYFGDRNKEGNFVKFSKEEGDEQRKLRINANVEIGSGSSGLENLSEWANKQADIDSAKSNAEEALVIAGEANNYTDQVKNETLDLMAQKIGYADYADMLDKISGDKTIISGGMLNTSIIVANAIKASMIDIENLFAQQIEANNLLLKEGCSIGDDIKIGKINVNGEASGQDDKVSLYSKIVHTNGTREYTTSTRISSGQLISEGYECKMPGDPQGIGCLVPSIFSVNAERDTSLTNGRDIPLVLIQGGEKTAMEVYGSCYYYGNMFLNPGINGVTLTLGGIAKTNGYLRKNFRHIVANDIITIYDDTIYFASSATNATLTLDDNLIDDKNVGKEITILFHGASSTTQYCTIKCSQSIIFDYKNNVYAMTTASIKMFGMIKLILIKDNAGFRWLIY